MQHRTNETLSCRVPATQCTTYPRIRFLIALINSLYSTDTLNTELLAPLDGVRGDAVGDRLLAIALSHVNRPILISVYCFCQLINPSCCAFRRTFERLQINVLVYLARVPIIEPKHPQLEPDLVVVFHCHTFWCDTPRARYSQLDKLPGCSHKMVSVQIVLVAALVPWRSFSFEEVCQLRALALLGVHPVAYLRHTALCQRGRSAPLHTVCTRTADSPFSGTGAITTYHEIYIG